MHNADARSLASLDEPQTTANAHLISPGLLRGLDSVPFHGAAPLTRWLMSGGQVHPRAQTHIAVHRIDAVEDQRRAYCDVHEHTVAEFNLILPFTSLTFDIVLGDERYEVEGPASIFIPPGLPHSANVRAGSGFFVAIVLGVQQYADAFAPAV